MKRIIGMLMLCAGTVLAQEVGESATVPLHDP